MADRTSSKGKSIEDLLAERQQFEMWLDRLDQNDDLASEDIRKKVRGDYQSRLDTVLVELRSHEDEVTGKLATLKSSLEDLGAKRTEAEAALTEAKVRHAVGEYDEDTWSELKGRHEDDLNKYDSQLDEITVEVERLSEIHKLISSAPGTPAPAATPSQAEAAPKPPEPESKPAKDILELAPDQPAAGAEPKEEAPPMGAPTFTPRGAEGGGEPTAPRTLRFPVDEAASEKKADELDFLKSVTEEAPAGDALTPPAADQSEPSPAAAGADKGNQPKTLKCTECGAMNRPTEWYCEVCGAELASL